MILLSKSWWSRVVSISHGCPIFKWLINKLDYCCR
jgi:hypothetical protein